MVSIFLYQFDEDEDEDAFFEENDADVLVSDYIEQLGFLKKHKSFLLNLNKLSFDFF